MPSEVQPIDVAQAPALPVEDLGPVVWGRTFFAQQRWGAVVGPSSRGDGWSAYLLYTDHVVVRDPWTIYEINLQTEEVRAYHGQKCDCWFPELMPDGCIYVFPEDTQSRPRKAYVARVDPRKGRLEIFGPGSPDSWNRCTSWGPAWAMYIGGYRLQHAMRFDPRTGEFTDYGPQAPDSTVVEGIYHIAADEHYVYTTMGGRPYYLVSCHKETRRRQVLLKLDWPQRAVLVRRPEGVFVIIDIQRNTPRLTDPTDEIVGYYRLQDNGLTPVDRLPPAPEVTPKRSPGGLVKPEVLATSPVCRGDGTATLWYRRPGEAWKSVTFRAGQSPSYLFRLGVFFGTIVGASEDPYNIFQYAPATGIRKVLGSPYGLHTYAFQESNGKLYFVGYAGAPVFEYDPRRPWTCQPPSPLAEVPPPSSPEANPRCVAAFDRQRRSYDIVQAADGRLYVPCSANVESLPGGLLGWYDPKTGQSGGIREGFQTHRGHDAALALDGRYVVVTTTPWPSGPPEGEAAVVVFDTRAGQLVGRLTPVAGCADPGELVEWKPGLMVGRAVQWAPGALEGSAPPPPEKALTTFYLLDVTARSSRVIGRLRRDTHGRLLRLADGRIGCLSRDMALALDPDRGVVSIMGRADRVIRDWIQLGDDIYLILESRLGRVHGEDL